MKITSLLTVVGWLSALSITAPTTPVNENTSNIAKRTPAWEAYFDHTSAQHQADFTKWSGLGYRMISLSVYGSPSNNKYAAVWVSRPGPTWVACHEASGAAYQTFFDKYSALGYVSTIVSVTGSSGSPVYAGVMEKNGVSSWYQKCGLSLGAFNTELDNAQKNSYMLKSFAQYGGSTFCGVWHINSQFDKYTTFADLSYADYQTKFTSEITKPFWRPSYFAVSEGHTMTAMFTDTEIGSWVARHGMNAAEMQAEYVTQKAAGRYIIHMQGGGTGSNTDFAAIFAEHDVPTPRTWRTTGTVTGFQNNVVAQANADSMMETWMKKNGVRQAQLSVAKAGKILMEKGFTWSESNRHTVVSSDRFLLASNSKMFLEAAVEAAIKQNIFSLKTLVYPRIGYPFTVDPRHQLIDVDMLLRHYGGTSQELGFDATYRSRLISATMLGNGQPAEVKDVVKYMSMQFLDTQPNSTYAYSNYGFVLLSYLIEVASGQNYYDFLKANVLDPGAYDVAVYRTKPSFHINDPITQESKSVGPNALTPSSSTEIAAIFGGDGMCKEDAYAAASLSTSASTLARFIGKHAVWGMGGRTISTRFGSTPGAESCASSRGDGLDYALNINTRDFAPYADKQEPFFNILCGPTIATFLSGNPIA